MTTRNALNLPYRPRRLRRTDALRRMAQEAVLTPSDLVQPVFIVDGKGSPEPISSMPGVARLPLTHLAEEAKQLVALGIPAIALFPKIDDRLKDERGTGSTDKKGLVPRAIDTIKQAAPELMIVCDVALDPYTTTGQDGIVVNGEILNDETIHALIDQALCEAAAGADIVAPSDMMDGRVGAIRTALDEAGYEKTLILSYSAKYASSFYGPFRDALDSAPRGGADKKTYQMDPGNAREAIREAQLDVEEGADILMVKPALPYLDIVALLRETTTLPIAAYHVSGEYAMLKAAAERGWLDGDKCMMEALVCIKRAGADTIFTYAAKDIARKL